MKFSSEQDRSFNPVKLTITCETIDELTFLLCLVNASKDRVLDSIPCGKFFDREHAKEVIGKSHDMRLNLWTAVSELYHDVTGIEL